MAENGKESLSSMKAASPVEQQAAEAGHQKGKADTQVETENENGLKQTQKDGKSEAGHQQGKADTQVETENENGLKQTPKDAKGEDTPQEETAELPEPSKMPSQLPQTSQELNTEDEFGEFGLGDKESEAGDADKTQDAPIAFGLNDMEIRKAIWKSTGISVPLLSKEAIERSQFKENVEPSGPKASQDLQVGQGLPRGNRMPCSELGSAGGASSTGRLLAPAAARADDENRAAAAAKRKRSDLDQQKKGLDAFLGKGNSVMERMRLCGVNVDESDGNVGLDVQSTIFKRFQVGEVRSIPWFKADGTPYICRHEVNQRKVGSRIKKYSLSIKKKGIVQGVRGEPWVVYNQKKDQYECISYGTLSQAFYRAHEDFPDAPLVRSTLEQGLCGVRVLDSRTPSEVLMYLRDLHNSFHDGLSITFNDAVEGIGEVEKAWRSYCDFKQMTHRNCKIQQELYSYIRENWSERYKTGQQYDIAKRLNHDLRDMNTLDEWCNYFGVHAEHPEGESTLTILQNMSAFAAVLSTSFGPSHDSGLLGLVAMEGCKFLAALDLDDELRRLPDSASIFGKNNPAIFERLKTPVAGAAWVNKVMKGQGDSGPKSKARPKAKGKAKAKAKAKAAAISGVNPEEDREDVEGDVKMTMADSRPRWWLDDLLGCLLRAAKGTPASILADDSLRKTFQTCVSYALEFCWYKTVTINQKQLKLWSQVRPQLQDMMHKVHAVLPPGDSEDIIKRLLGQMQTDSSSESKKPESLPVTAAKSKDACDQVQAWIRTNDSKDISSQPAFARFKTKLKNELCKCSLTKREPKCPMHGLDSSLYSTVTLGDIMYHTADAIFESIPAYVPTVAMGLSMIHEDAKGRLDLGEDSCHYPPTCSFLLMKAKEEPDGKMIDVPNAEALDVLLSIRGAYLREGLQDVLEMIRNIDECYFDALTDVKKLPEVLRGLRGRGSGVLALVEGKLCMTGADATVWGSIWQTILHTLGATGMLPALSDLFSNEIEEPFRVKEEADEDGKAVDVDAVESVPSKSRTRDEDDDPADEPNSKRRLVGFMEKARASGEIDMTEMTVTMKSVYTFSEAGLVEPIHIVDLMNVKKELELFLMKRAMSEWGSALEHVTLNYAKSMVMCKRRSPFEDSSKHRIYVFGQISMEASNKTIKVASLKHVNGPCGISFYCGPNGYDRMTSQIPCAAWLMKVVGSHDDDSDDEASTSTMVKSTEKATLKVASLFDPEKTFELELELPYLHARPLDEWQKKKEMAKAKKRKTGAEDSMVQITRPPFLSRKSLQAAAKGDNMVYTFGGKTAEEIFKDPAKIKPTTKNNRELLADRGNTGKEVSHLMN